MQEYYHCVDMGRYRFIKDNGDGTGTFEKVLDLLRESSTALRVPDGDIRKYAGGYKWKYKEKICPIKA